MCSIKTIVLSPQAAKSLDRLPAESRDAVARALHEYALHRTGDVKAMVGTATARLRVGDYRVIFDETATTITMLVLGHRRDIYR